MADAERGRGDINAKWNLIQGRLQADFSEAEYRTWIRQIQLSAIDGDELTLLLPTRFLRDWVREHYETKLRALVQAAIPEVRRIEIRVAPQQGGELPPPPPPPVATAPAGPERHEVSVDPRFTFPTFVVGKPNEFAYACARRVAERPSTPGSTRYSCMAVWGWARRI